MIVAHNIPTRSGQDSRYEHVINQHDNLLWGRPAMMWLGIVACDHYQCPVPGADTPDALPPPIACDLRYLYEHSLHHNVQFGFLNSIPGLKFCPYTLHPSFLVHHRCCAVTTSRTTTVC